MADINITQLHKMSLEKARTAAQNVAEKMADEFDISSTWEGDTLTFTRSGVHGTLTVLDKEVRLEITLGFMLRAFASSIEEKVALNMGKVFGGKA